MAARILIVEDEPAVQDLLTASLSRGGFKVACASDAATARASIREALPDVVVLDWMMPGETGISLARALREDRRTKELPIIMLTARASEADKVSGLDTGADDYITKPFSPRELVARVKAVLRRCEAPLLPGVIHAGDLEIDTMAMVLTVRGTAVTATATEFRLLHFLAQHAGRVFTRDQILDAVWKETAFVSPRSVDVYVRKLRSKIEVDPEEPRYLRTVRGAGYRFEAPKK
jgi:two-component system, OmpR family, phosphate regulon response regulator PhoB